VTQRKILIVGSFPGESETQVKGGVRRACSLLEKSRYFKDFECEVVDSTQKHYPSSTIWVRSLSAIYRIFKVINILIRRKPDMVLLFCTNGLSFYEKSLTGLLARGFGSKSVLFPRGSAEFSKLKLLNKLGGIFLRRSNLIICQGKEIQDFIQSSYQVNENKLVVIENWTATELLLEIGKNRKYLDETVYKILFVGWLEKSKGTDNIKDVAKYLSNSKHSYEFHLVGDGSKKDQLEKELKHLELEGKLFFHSWINDDQLRKLYSSCHIFFLPSWEEGLPNSLIEAMSSGLVPVTTPVGNIPSILKSGSDGFICPVKDSKPMIANIDYLLSNTIDLFKMSIEAKTTAEKRFSTIKNINKLIAITNSVINGKYD
jgi:glycosyltransferase involved in cell wall biosynthesis